MDIQHLHILAKMGVVEGNIKQYDLTGAGVPLPKISESPMELKLDELKKEVETTLKPPGTETTLKPPVEPVKEPIKKPNQSPPFNLTIQEGKANFKQWVEFMINRYTQVMAQREIDNVYEDSVTFTLAYEAIRKIELSIDSYNNMAGSGFAKWFNNIISELLSKVLSGIIDGAKKAIQGILTAGTGGMGFIVGEVAGAGMDELKGYLNGLVDFKTDFVGKAQETINKIINMKPGWKSALEITKKQYEDHISPEARKKREEEINKEAGKKGQETQDYKTQIANERSEVLELIKSGNNTTKKTKIWAYVLHKPDYKNLTEAKLHLKKIFPKSDYIYNDMFSNLYLFKQFNLKNVSVEKFIEPFEGGYKIKILI